MSKGIDGMMGVKNVLVEKWAGLLMQKRGETQRGSMGNLFALVNDT